MSNNSPQKKISRRQFLVAAAATAASATLAACGEKATPTSKPAAATEVPTPAPPEEITMTILTPYGTWAEGEMTAVQEAYMKLNPHITLTPPIWGEESQTGFLETLMARVAAGDPPDIAISWDTPISMGVRGALMPLDELMAVSKYSGEENWPADLLKSCQFRGKSYGFPSFNACYSLWYNADAFEAAGLPSERKDFPKTWGDLRKTSKEFTQWEGEDLLKLGYFPVWNHIGLTDVFFQLNGGAAFDADNMVYTLDREENIEALEYAVSWIDEEFHSYDEVMNAGWGFLDVQGGEPAFQDGRNIIIHAGNFMMGMYRGENPPQFRWEMVGFPVGPKGTKEKTMIWPNWTSIPTGTKHPQEAFEFLDWFNGEGVFHWVTTQPDMPGNDKFHENNPDYLPDIVVENLGKEFAEEFHRFYIERLTVAARVWDSPVQTFHFDQMLRASERVLKKVATAKEALTEAQTASQAELEKLL